MNSPASNLKEWMDANNVSKKEACKRFGISMQTLYNWRSVQVPDSKQAHVNYVIACWEKPTAASLGQTLLLTPTPEQFRHWNHVANKIGLLIEDWAITGLDKYAEEIEARKKPLTLVAEEELNPMNPNGKNGLGNG